MVAGGCGLEYVRFVRRSGYPASGLCGWKVVSVERNGEGESSRRILVPFLLRACETLLNKSLLPRAAG